MNCNGEMQQLMGYVRSVVTGAETDFDVIDQRAIKTTLKQPLYMWLLRLAEAGCKIRGARGNTPRDVLELIEQVRVGVGISKLELAKRSGVSRGHVYELLGNPDPRPLVETIVRLAVGLDFPLEVVDLKDRHIDDADPEMPGQTGFNWQQVRVLGARIAYFAGAGLIVTAILRLFRDARGDKSHAA